MPPTHVQMSLNWAQGHHGGPDWPKNDCLISVRNDPVPDVLWCLLWASHIQQIDGMKPAQPTQMAGQRATEPFSLPQSVSNFL